MTASLLLVSSVCFSKPICEELFAINTQAGTLNQLLHQYYGILRKGDYLRAGTFSFRSEFATHEEASAYLQKLRFVTNESSEDDENAAEAMRVVIQYEFDKQKRYYGGRSDVPPVYSIAHELWDLAKAQGPTVPWLNRMSILSNMKLAEIQTLLQQSGTTNDWGIVSSAAMDTYFVKVNNYVHLAIKYPGDPQINYGVFNFETGENVFHRFHAVYFIRRTIAISSNNPDLRLFFKDTSLGFY